MGADDEKKIFCESFKNLFSNVYIKMKQKIILSIAILSLLSLAVFVSATMSPNTWPGRSDIVGYETSIPVIKGWNLVPAVFYMNEAILPTSDIWKEDISAMWYYSTNTNKYFQLHPEMDLAEAEMNDEQVVQTDYDNYVMTSGVWMYSEKSGTLKYNMFVSNYDYMNKRNLVKGYNFVVITPSMVNAGNVTPESTIYVDDFKGTCNILKAYVWDIEHQRWEDITSQDQFYSQADGMIWVIKVADNCKLNAGGSSGSSGTGFPQLPN